MYSPYSAAAGELWLILGVMLTLFVGVAWLIARIISRPVKADVTPAATGRSKALLTPTEALFLPVLRHAAAPCPVWPKVRLYDVAEPAGHNGRDHALSMRQHLDFVVVDPTTWQAVAVVELDDPSHGGWEAKKRDAVKDATLAGAGVPLLRVTAAQHYDAGEIAGRLTPLLHRTGLDTHALSA